MPMMIMVVRLRTNRRLRLPPPPWRDAQNS
jgi:hypothetical protein